LIYIDIFNNYCLTALANTFNLNNALVNYNNIPEIYTIYIKISTAFFNFCLILFLILFIFNFIIYIFFKRFSVVNKFFFYVNFLISIIIEITLIIKLYLSFTIEGILKSLILQEKLNFYKNNKDIQHLEHFVVFSSAFSDIIILLSVIIGLICLDILGPKNYFDNISNNGIFYLFNVFVIIMASTNNLLIMFICFECIFLPTVFFAYKFGYSKKIDKAALTLFTWTLFGSFLVLCGLLYIYYRYNSLNYLILSEKRISLNEKRVLFYIFLIGFSIKIPLAPLHYWLLKVHVESPTAYSIFLSGFLVKSALYCLSMLLQQFYASTESIPALIWFLYSLTIGTYGIGRQSDLKKLIAWCTVQEMSFIIMFWGLKQTYLDKHYLLFVIMHGLLSAYMFLLVDIIQRRYETRNIAAITGINLISPQLTKYVWFLILIFSGFPLSAKFVIEWNLFCLLSNYGFILYLIVAFTVNVAGVILFSRIMLNILYGTPKNIVEPMVFDIQKREFTLLNTLMYLIIILTILIYIIIE